MLYVIEDDFKYKGQYYLNNDPITRQCVIDDLGRIPAWFDNVPTFHHRWVNTQSKDGEIVVDLTLNECKAIKAADLAHQTAKFEDNLNKDMYFTSSLGFRVNGDRRTRSNIEDLIAFTQTFPVAYRDYDNVMRNVTEEELRTMLVEHITNGNNLYQTKWLLESQIQKCTTIDEVNAIEIKFEMMDFSK